MASLITQIVDAESRVTLPKEFAQSTVTLDISPTEIRIRKVNEVESTSFREEIITCLSDADRDRFLELIEHPPLPNAKLQELMSGQ